MYLYFSIFTTEKEQLLKDELILKGYSQQEINNILQGLQDVKDGKVHSAQEVYESLLSKQKVYA